MVSQKEIIDILDMGIRDDGTFYTNEERAELLYSLFDEETKKVFDRGYNVGYDRGV
jgi:hypothetical protein